jgi:hypothetical protein
MNTPYQPVPSICVLDGVVCKQSVLEHMCSGTGKTMIGVSVTRALLTDPTCAILLLTYTNHALDQFCEAILDSGLPDAQLLRIGSRAGSERIKKVALNTLRPMRATLDYPEQMRRFDLFKCADKAKKGIKEKFEMLTRIQWGTPKYVPLLAVEHIIQVCVHESTLAAM